MCDLCPKCDEWYDSEKDTCPHCVKVDALETKWTLAEDALFRLRHSLKEIHDGMMDSAGRRPHVHEPIPGIREGWEYASCMGLMTEVLLLRGRTTGLREATEVVRVFYASISGHAILEHGARHEPTIAEDAVETVHSRILVLDPPAAEVVKAGAGEKGG